MKATRLLIAGVCLLPAFAQTGVISQDGTCLVQGLPVASLCEARLGPPTPETYGRMTWAVPA